jgi:hypothetical protein
MLQKEVQCGLLLDAVARACQITIIPTLAMLAHKGWPPVSNRRCNADDSNQDVRNKNQNETDGHGIGQTAAMAAAVATIFAIVP